MRFEISGIAFTISDQEPFVDEAFNRASLEFFDRANDDTSLHDRYFSILAGFINRHIQAGLWYKAETMWRSVIQPALDWEAQHPNRFIHKGTPFYFWGMAAIIRGELDMGYPLMHQALQEDIRTHQNARPDTPAYAFATLDYTKVDQAFRDWTEYQARFLEPLLENYRSSHTMVLNLDDFRRRFLLSPPSLDVIFLFTYALGKFSLFDRVPPYARQNDFTSQLELNLLFDILLVIDASIGARNPGVNSFPLHAAHLSNEAGLGLTQNKLQNELNPVFQADFNLTLANILNGAFQFGDGTGLTGLAGDLAVAYGLRNYGAHHISSVPTVQLRFNEIRQSLFNVLFLTIEMLY